MHLCLYFPTELAGVFECMCLCMCLYVYVLLVCFFGVFYLSFFGLSSCSIVSFFGAFSACIHVLYVWCKYFFCKFDFCTIVGVLNSFALHLAYVGML